MKLRYFDREESIALTLYCSAAETLITEESPYKKREPLADVLSKLFGDDLNCLGEKEIRFLIDSLYKKRSAFIHAGKYYKADNESVENLDNFEKVLASFILDSLSKIQGEDRKTQWLSYVKKNYSTKKTCFFNRLLKRH